MNKSEILEKIQSCINCKKCFEVCDTYKVTQDEKKSPNGRLKIAEKVFNDDKISQEELISLYTCTLCAICDLTCQKSIKISNIIHSSKIYLVEKQEAPLEINNKIITNIIENKNSVNGNPVDRLNWLPEKYKINDSYEKKDSDTLLFLGCMSSFRVTESASAPYKILKFAGYNFKILENEPCCGEYIYSAGNLNVAKKIFRENIDLFTKIGIKNLIVTCGGCLYAFDHVYRKYFEDYDISVRHIVDVIHELVDKGKIILNSINKSITYHDPCRLGRKYKNNSLSIKARQILRKCGLEIKEISHDPEECPCCGAGSGIRGVESRICVEIGKELFKKVETKEIVTSCPLCVFNFRYVIYKNQLVNESKFITDYILQSLRI